MSSSTAPGTSSSVNGGAGGDGNAKEKVPRVYNAIYSAVQVYECMVRGIAVMRRRVDSFVNATQILKVAGIDKGRRTKILEKEILPGKHEIVQGGYGKYQGTWIPLERGREVALQFGVAPLLAPLFDYVPPSAIMPHPRLPVPNAARSHAYYPPAGLQASPHFNTPPSHFSFHPSTPQPFPSQSRSSPLLPQSYTVSPSADSLKANNTRSQSSVSTPHLSQPHYYPNSNPYLNPPSPRPPLPGASALKRQREDSVNLSKKGGESRSATTDTKAPQPFESIKQPPAKRVRTTDTNGTSTGFKPSPLPLPPIDPSMRYFSKGIPQSADRPSPVKNTRYRAIVAAISQDAEASTVMELLQTPEPSGSIDIDVIIDDQGHTALHWAAALSRLSLVESLIGAGADIHRGNDSGETPLIRTILSLASFNAHSFPEILSLLAASLRTVDSSSRSILHHIALVAGVKLRGPSARYYMECVLEYIARNEGGEKGLKSVVDLQDVHGDTALNLAARVGNRSIVRNLIDVGANKVLANKLGLRPGDFGVEDESLKTPSAGDILSALSTGPSPPVQKSQDVVADLTSMIDSLNADFSAEIKIKQDQLDVTQSQLRAATRELADQRRKIQQWQARCTELDQVRQRIRNVERAAQEEEGFDWTGLGYSQLEAIIDGSNDPSYGPSLAADIDPTIPSTDSLTSLIQLRRVKAWHGRIENVMNERLNKLKGMSAEKEYQCKRIVSLCTGVPVDKVEPMLENLLIAMESDGPVPELARVAGFMQKVRSTSP